MSTQIPPKYQDLLERPAVAQLATIMPDGQPQVTPVWFDYDGDYIRVNTARGRQKDQNLSERPQATINVVDPDNPYRYIEIRGVVVKAQEDGAVDHINLLSKKYTGNYDYNVGKDTRVMYFIEPKHINTQG